MVFFIALLVYSSRHVCINISFLRVAKCTHDAGSSCSDWISVLYLGRLAYVVVVVNNPAHRGFDLGPLVCCMWKDLWDKKADLVALEQMPLNLRLVACSLLLLLWLNTVHFGGSTFVVAYISWFVLVLICLLDIYSVCKTPISVSKLCPVTVWFAVGFGAINSPFLWWDGDLSCPYWWCLLSFFTV